MNELVNQLKAGLSYNGHLKDKDTIVMDMCRHIRPYFPEDHIPLEDRKQFYLQMKSLFENCIEPYMGFRSE